MKNVGPDLASRKDKSPESLLIALLDPNRNVEPKYVAYTAITTEGRTYTGILADESSNGLVLVGIRKGEGRAFAKPDRGTHEHVEIADARRLGKGPFPPRHGGRHRVHPSIRQAAAGRNSAAAKINESPWVAGAGVLAAPRFGYRFRAGKELGRPEAGRPNQPLLRRCTGCMAAAYQTLAGGSPLPAPAKPPFHFFFTRRTSPRHNGPGMPLRGNVETKTES